MKILIIAWIVCLSFLLLILVVTDKCRRKTLRRIEEVINAIYLKKPYANKEIVDRMSIHPKDRGVKISGGLEEEVEHFKKGKDKPSDDEYFERAKGVDVK